jgi:hypothetical protein
MMAAARPGEASDPPMGTDIRRRFRPSLVLARIGRTGNLDYSQRRVRFRRDGRAISPLRRRSSLGDSVGRRVDPGSTPQLRHNRQRRLPRSVPRRDADSRQRLSHVPVSGPLTSISASQGEPPSGKSRYSTGPGCPHMDIGDQSDALNLSI